MIFEEIYEELYQDIFRFTYRITDDMDLAGDITQETFLKLYHETRKNGNSLKNPKAWLYRVAANLCNNLLRRKITFRRILQREIEFEKSVNNIESNYIKKEEMEILKKSISRLSKRDQILLQLYQDGLSYSEIAEITSIKKTSIGKLLSRAIDKCARNVER